jgi:hypothetical protein
MIPSSSSPQEHTLRNQIETIAPDGYEQLGRIESFEHERAYRIVNIILRFCCTSQHIGGITAGKNAFKALPRRWVSENLRSIAERAIDLDDAWDYRRLLETLV